MVITRQTGSSAFDPGLPAIYLLHFFDAVVQDLARQRELLAAAGLHSIDHDPEHRVALDRVLALIEILDQQGRPGWHIEPALAMEAAHHGPVGIAVTTAPRVHLALALLSRFEPLRAPFAVLQAQTDETGWSARILPTGQRDGPWDLLLEIHQLVLVGLLERLLGRNASVLSLQMPASYRSWRAHLRRRFGDRLVFAGHHYRLGLPGDVLNEPCRLANQDMHRDALARSEQAVRERLHSSPLAAEIRARLLARGGRSPGLEAMAAELACSARTLIRRLAGSGTSYRELVDETRRTIAADLLRRSDLPISRIAERLGYQDTANFGRACRRWFGDSPGRFKKNASDADGH